ncbi:hypothetical protein REPUB_Repub07fG0096100 [Reevesia pubescens]
MGMLKESKKLFDEMPERDTFSWTTMILGYVRFDKPKEALELYTMKEMSLFSKLNKFIVSSALIASAVMGCLIIGKEIHGHITRAGLDLDDVVWSALMDMYFKDVRQEEEFELFRKLMKSGIRPNEFTFSRLLNACTDEAGSWLHDKD